MKEPTVIPWSMDLYRLVTAPQAMRWAMEVPICSVWMPRSCFSIKWNPMALGMLPKPSWMQSPSFIISVT